MCLELFPQKLVIFSTDQNESTKTFLTCLVNQPLEGGRCGSKDCKTCFASHGTNKKLIHRRDIELLLFFYQHLLVFYTFFFIQARKKRSRKKIKYNRGGMNTKKMTENENEKKSIRFSSDQHDALWKKFGPFLHEQENHLQKRRRLIQWISTCYNHWLGMQSVFQKKTAEFLLKSTISPIVCTGSLQLGTSHNMSDIDLVFFAPQRISRTHFFRTFSHYVQSQGKRNFIDHQPILIEQVEIRSAAFVPLIRMRINNVIFDCLYSCLPNKKFGALMNCSTKNVNLTPESYLYYVYKSPMEQKELITSLDEKSRLSLDPIFMTFCLFEHVPPNDRAKWVQFIQYVHLWARRKNVCTNITGFPSTIAFVILATKVYKLHSTENPLTLFALFFETYAQWNWAEQAADMISSPDQDKDNGRTPKVTEFKKKNSDDQDKDIGKTPKVTEFKKKNSDDPMVVWLPILCSSEEKQRVNTCKNVTLATLNILIEEFRIAHQQLASFSLGTFVPPQHPPQLIQETENLFGHMMKRRFFFKRYPYFIQLCFSGISYYKSVLESQKENKQGILIDFLKWQLKFLLSDLDSFVTSAEIYEHFFPLSVNTQCIYLGFQLQPESRLEDTKTLASFFRKRLIQKVNEEYVPDTFQFVKIRLHYLNTSHPTILSHIKQEEWKIKTKELG